MDRVRFRSRRLLGGSLVLLTTACAAYQIGNPFLPEARILVTVNPSVVESKIAYDENVSSYVYETRNADFQLSPFPNDTTPAVTFTDYEVTYRNQDGAEISPFTIPKRRLAATVFVNRSGVTGGGAPAAGGGAPAAGGGGQGAAGGGQAGAGIQPTCTVPVVSEDVIRYAITNGFVKVGSTIAQNPENWSSNLSGFVTFYGRDENLYPIRAQGTFTINFRTSVTRKSGGN